MYNQNSNYSNPFDYENSFHHHCGHFFKNAFEKFGNDRRNEWYEKFQNFFAGKKAANITDQGDSFIIELFAAGLIKSNFKVEVRDDVLTIRYSESNKKEDKKYVLREYKLVSFERRFQLNNRVLTENISATYQDGVLSIILKKNPETNQPEQEITVE